MEDGEGGVQGQLDKLYEQAEKSELAKGERKVMARLADGLIVGSERYSPCFFLLTRGTCCSLFKAQPCCSVV